MATNRVLVIGKSGQVARALSRASARSVLSYRFAGRNEADLREHMALKAIVNRINPQLIVNAAAYTAVDQAEADSTEAYAVNADGPRDLAIICSERDIPLIHLSTDYVFDGTKRSPYLPSDATGPINVYGASKLAGETAVRELAPKHVVLRLAWVYSESGRNFLNTMLRLAKAGNELRVVDDQVGAPSYAGDIAAAIDGIATKLLLSGDNRSGTYHLANAGQTSWYGFASKIFEISGRLGGPRPAIVRIATSDYPTPARRPLYSVLDSTETAERFGISMPDWNDALERCMTELNKSTGQDQRRATS